MHFHPVATLVVVVGNIWFATSERTNLNIPLFKIDFCSNIQGKQGGKLFGKSWKKISHQNEVETRLVQVMIDAPFDSRVY